jgi:threonine synthase
MTPFVYRCSDCGTQYARDAVRYLCPVCEELGGVGEPLRGVLEVEFDDDELRRQFVGRPGDLSPFCPVEPEFHPPYSVGGTPLVAAPRLGERFGFSQLLLKNDTVNPSGSLKDRASFLVVAEANRLGESVIVAASTGNAGSSLAAVCAAAGKRALLFVPEAAPKAKLVQMLLYGAEVVRLKGSYDDAFALSLEYTRRRGGLNRNTAYHPLTIEGKKTVALEIYAQTGRRVPAAIVVPVGDGVIISGVHKGFRDLLRCNLIDRLPRLIGVQAESSDAIHRYVTTGRYGNASSPHTIADSISVATPSNAHMARRAIEESRGFTLTVTDEEIMSGQALLCRTTGVFAEPAAAATVAALDKLAGRLPQSEPVVLLITGHGLKDVEAASSGLILPEPVDPVLDAIPGGAGS